MNDLAAIEPEKSTRIVVAVPQDRRLWKRRRKTSARRKDFTRRGRRKDRETKVLNWVDLESDVDEGRMNDMTKVRRKEKRDTRKEKGKKEKAEDDERMNGSKE